MLAHDVTCEQQTHCRTARILVVLMVVLCFPCIPFLRNALVFFPNNTKHSTNNVPNGQFCRNMVCHSAHKTAKNDKITCSLIKDEGSAQFPQILNEVVCSLPSIRGYATSKKGCRLKSRLRRTHYLSSEQHGHRNARLKHMARTNRCLSRARKWSISFCDGIF
jgi:hypothetical protein